MEIEIPDLSRFTSVDGEVALEIPHPGSGRCPRLMRQGRQELIWPEPLTPPSEVVMVPALQRVVLLGEIGDAGLSVGQLEVRAFSGERLYALDLRNHIPGLDRLALASPRSMGHFPWIDAAEVRDGNLTVDVVERFRVTLDMVSFALSIVPLPSAAST